MKHVSEIMAETLDRHGLTRRASLHFDGACEPQNPGGVATAGWLVTVAGEIIAEGAEVVCEGAGATNNVAEYHAFGRGLKWVAGQVSELAALGVVAIDCFGDSQLVVEQVAGRWRCNKPHLEKLRDRCRELLSQIRSLGIAIDVAWVPRDENELADALSRSAYEAHTGKTFSARRR